MEDADSVLVAGGQYRIGDRYFHDLMMERCAMKALWEILFNSFMRFSKSMQHPVSEWRMTEW